MKQNRLRELRNEKGLTQLEVVDKMDIKRASYTHYENGDR